MFAFLRGLFGGSPDRDRNGIPMLKVSVNMRMESFQRLDRLARSLNMDGDVFVDLALREWLEKHEADLLARRVRVVTRTS